MILVSACLADIACRYDGQAKTNEDALRLVYENKAIAACPELMAGFFGAASVGGNTRRRRV